MCNISYRFMYYFFLISSLLLSSLSPFLSLCLLLETGSFVLVGFCFHKYFQLQYIHKCLDKIEIYFVCTMANAYIEQQREWKNRPSSYLLRLSFVDLQCSFRLIFSSLILLPLHCVCAASIRSLFRSFYVFWLHKISLCFSTLINFTCRMVLATSIYLPM